jgi:hypothetical protein
MKVLILSAISFSSLYLFVGATDKKVIIEDRIIRADSLYRTSEGDSVVYLKPIEYDSNRMVCRANDNKRKVNP